MSEPIGGAEPRANLDPRDGPEIGLTEAEVERLREEAGRSGDDAHGPTS